jgi:plasmid stabilization system protein ParE
VNVSYGQAAADDIVQQFRYYFVESDTPEIAVRFLDAVRRTVESLRLHPRAGPRYLSRDPQIRNLRSWPVAGFEAIRIYYSVDAEVIDIVRLLHGKRDVRNILKSE